MSTMSTLPAATKSVPISTERRYVTAGRRRSVTPEGLTTMPPSVKLVKVESLKKEAEKLDAVMQRRKVGSGEIQDDEIGKDQESRTLLIVDPPSQTNGPGAVGDQEKRNSNEFKRHMLESLARGDSFKSNNDVQTLILRGDSFGQPKEPPTPPLSSERRILDTNSNGGTSSGSSTSTTPQNASSNLVSLQQTQMQSTASGRRAEFGRSESRRSILEISRMSPERLPSPESSEWSQRRPTSLELGRPAHLEVMPRNAANRSAMSPKDSPSRPRVGFERPQTAAPDGRSGSIRSLQKPLPGALPSPPLASPNAFISLPSTPDRRSLQSASGLRPGRSSMPSGSVSPTPSRAVISSWSPGNTGLHWHEDLTGTSHDMIPGWVWQRQNLRILLIGRNNLSTLPQEIGQLQHLRELSASNNLLSDLPTELFNLKLLQRLDVSFNEIDSISDNLEKLTELRNANFSHNLLNCLPRALMSGRLSHLQVLNASFNRLTELPRNWDSLPQLQILNVSYNQLTVIPSQIRYLAHLETLDVSFNRLRDIPINELKLMFSNKGQQGALKCIECKGNPQLVRPPPEINEQGGHAVAVYLRASVSGDEEIENTDMVMVVFGERGCGKTSMVQALLSEDDRSPKLERNTGAVGVEFSSWEPEQKLSYHIIDLTGQEISSNVLQLFLVRRAVYVFVWAIRTSHEGLLPEWEVMHMQTTVKNWIDSLQHRVPGASMVLVATHVDTAPPEEIQMQCDLIRDAACHRLEQHSVGLARRGASQMVPIIQIFNSGHSLQINSLDGTGVARLRKELIQFTKSTQWYCEPIPSRYIRLRDKVQQMGSADKREWLPWREYQNLAHDCGIVGSDHLRIATLFLNDMGVLRYFGDVDSATSAGEKLAEGDGIKNLVFISLKWIVNVMKGLFKPDRDNLLEFFSKSEYADKAMYLRVRRLMTHGVIHPTLVPFLWPKVPDWPTVSSASVEEFWSRSAASSSQPLSHIAHSADGLRRVLRLIEGLDIGAINDENEQQRQESNSEGSSLVVPGLLSRSHRFRVDARVFGDDCLFRCDIEYLTVPPGFFEKLLVSLRKHANHMDFNTRSAAFYKMGTKLQVFMSKSEIDPAAPTTITALFSQTKLWQHFKADIVHVERFFPGLHRAGFSFHVAKSLSSKRALLVESSGEQKASVIEEEVRRMEVDLERVKNPVQVLISHSNTSTTAASALASCLRSIDKSMEVVQEVPVADEDTIDARVTLVCVDAEYATTTACLEQFRAQVKNGRMIVPLIMPGYEFADFSSWWPNSMPEMQQFSLFMDLRAEEWTDLEWKTNRKHYYKSRGQLTDQLKRLATTGDPWAIKELAYAHGDAQKQEYAQRIDTVKALHKSIRKLLEEWRGSTPVAEGENSVSVVQDIPCVECIRQGDDKPATLSRADCLALLEKSKKGTFKEKGGRMYVSNPTVVCKNGHELSVNTVLSSAVVYESVSCPSCVKHGITPPWCFNRHECLSYFDENDSGRVGAMTCPKCMKRGLPAIRILDILSPEVFLSYQWGMSGVKSGQQVFSTQELVKHFRKQIEIQTDVLCWLDVAGGLSVGDGDHMKRIEAGIQKAVVVVIFLSDAYVQSDNCKFELSKSLAYGKFLIPVLVPPEIKRPEVGWTGPGPEDPQWWYHAKKIVSRSGKRSQVEVDWESLGLFKAVDLRKMGSDEAEREITNRILGRFFRANAVVKPVSKAQKTWKKLNMARRLGLSRGMSRKIIGVV